MWSVVMTLFLSLRRRYIVNRADRPFRPLADSKVRFAVRQCHRSDAFTSFSARNVLLGFVVADAKYDNVVSARVDDSLVV